MEEIAAKKNPLEERSSVPDNYSEASPSEDSLESLFGDSFDFDDDSFDEDGVGDSPKWGLEGGRRLEDASTVAQREAKAEEEFKPPKTLAETLKDAAERAAACGVIQEV